MFKLVWIYGNKETIIREGAVAILQTIKKSIRHNYQQGLLKIKKVRTKCISCKGTGRVLSNQFPVKCDICKGYGTK